MGVATRGVGTRTVAGFFLPLAPDTFLVHPKVEFGFAPIRHIRRIEILVVFEQILRVRVAPQSLPPTLENLPGVFTLLGRIRLFEFLLRERVPTILILTITSLKKTRQARSVPVSLTPVLVSLTPVQKPRSCLILEQAPPRKVRLAIGHPRGACSVVVHPRGACSVVIRPCGACSVVIRPRGACSVVIRPCRACSVVIRPRGACSVVIRPCRACSVVVRPCRGCSVVVDSRNLRRFLR